LCNGARARNQQAVEAQTVGLPKVRRIVNCGKVLHQLPSQGNSYPRRRC